MKVSIIYLNQQKIKRFSLVQSTRDHWSNRPDAREPAAETGIISLHHTVAKTTGPAISRVLRHNRVAAL